MLGREGDGSRGAHNVDFTAEIMSSAAKDLREITSAIALIPKLETLAREFGHYRSKHPCIAARQYFAGGIP